MTARDFLAAVQQRADAATDGPWTQRNYTGDVVGNSSVLYGDRFGVRDIPWDDAEFIAAARTDVPRLVAALTAALDLADRADRFNGYADPEGVVTTDALRAAITAALTPKENDS